MHAYLAGLLDGEGSITMLRPGPRRARRPQVAIGMTTPAPVEAAKAALGGFVRVQPRQRPNQDMHYWQISGGPALDALHALHPYLVIARRVALAEMLFDSELVLRSHQWKYAHNEALFERMRARNAERLSEPPIFKRSRPRDPDFAYLAGILDGEGHVSERRIEVSSTDPELPAWLASKFDGSLYAYPARGNRRPQWTWKRSATGCRWAARVADLMLLPEKAEPLRAMQDFKRTPPPAPSSQPHPADAEYLDLRRDWLRKEAVARTGIPLARAKRLDARRP